MERVSPEQLADWVAAARRRWHVPGIAVAILDGGAVVSAADGVRGLGGEEPVSADTVFRIASVTKPFTATLAMTLVQDGLLALDEPPAGSPVDASVRQLLSHQGGLACEWPEPVDRFGESDEALLLISESHPERLPIGPGELYSYCNVGFWLVGAATARACGTSFEEALNARVLGPLGLDSTTFEPGRAARGHNQIAPGSDEHRPIDDRYPRVRRPSGGLWSSVFGLLRFAEHHLGGPGPLTQGSRAEMQTPQIDSGGDSYGLGWMLHDNRGRRVVEHPGSAAGFQSLLRLVPADNLAFAGLTNSSRGGAALRDVLERIGLDREPAPEFAMPAETLASLAGRYEGQGIALELAADDGGLRVEMSQFDPFSGEIDVYPSLRARPIGNAEFEIVDGEWRGERFDFPRDGFVNLGVLAARVE